MSYMCAINVIVLLIRVKKYPQNTEMLKIFVINEEIMIQKNLIAFPIF